jgi:Domain of unknown function (DUF4145)
MAERCGHCGRENSCEHVGRVVLSTKSDTVQVGGYLQEITTQQIAQISRCTGCDNLTLETYTWVDEMMDPEDVTLHQLYPQERSFADLPERVRARYEAMLELQHAPDAFAVRAGRLLEAVCADQGVHPKTDKNAELSQRLDQLVKQVGVPKALTDQAHLVRKYRNVGGHDNAWEVEDQDVPLIRRFVESLLDLLYWGPANLARVTAEFKRRETEAAAAQP